jgi:dTDP-4-dehydrorhamnose reductase
LIVSLDPLDAVSAWVAGALKSGETITLFEDEIRMPILVDDLAAMVWELAALSASQRRGVWHLVGPEALSRVQLGELVARYLGLDSSGLQVGSSASSPSPRPRDLRLSSVRAATLSVVPRSLTTVNPHGQAHR